jgi:hypothetical protein
MRLGQDSHGSSRTQMPALRLDAAGPVINEDLVGPQKVG